MTAQSAKVFSRGSIRRGHGCVAIARDCRHTGRLRRGPPSISTLQRPETRQKLSECRLDAIFAPWYNFVVKRETLMTDGFVEHHME